MVVPEHQVQPAPFLCSSYQHHPSPNSIAAYVQYLKLLQVFNAFRQLCQTFTQTKIEFGNAVRLEQPQRSMHEIMLLRV
ncbi:unnamed protein product [Urochloa humidicola]